MSSSGVMDMGAVYDFVESIHIFLPVIAVVFFLVLIFFYGIRGSPAPPPDYLARMEEPYHHQREKEAKRRVRPEGILAANKPNRLKDQKTTPEKSPEKRNVVNNVFEKSPAKQAELELKQRKSKQKKTSEAAGVKVKTEETLPEVDDSEWIVATNKRTQRQTKRPLAFRDEWGDDETGSQDADDVDENEQVAEQVEPDQMVPMVTIPKSPSKKTDKLPQTQDSYSEPLEEVEYQPVSTANKKNKKNKKHKELSPGAPEFIPASMTASAKSAPIGSIIPSIDLKASTPMVGPVSSSAEEVLQTLQSLSRTPSSQVDSSSIKSNDSARTGGTNGSSSGTQSSLMSASIATNYSSVTNSSASNDDSTNTAGSGSSGSNSRLHVNHRSVVDRSGSNVGISSDFSTGEYEILDAPPSESSSYEEINSASRTGGTMSAGSEDHLPSRVISESALADIPEGGASSAVSDDHQIKSQDEDDDDGDGDAGDHESGDKKRKKKKKKKKAGKGADKPNLDNNAARGTELDDVSELAVDADDFSDHESPVVETVTTTGIDNSADEPDNNNPAQDLESESSSPPKRKRKARRDN